MSELRVEYGGEPPFYRPKIRRKWAIFRDEFAHLEIPEGEEHSIWLHIHQIGSLAEAKRFQQMIAAITGNLKIREWDYETRVIQENDDTYTVWFRKWRVSGRERRLQAVRDRQATMLARYGKLTIKPGKGGEHGENLEKSYSRRRGRPPKEPFQGERVAVVEGGNNEEE